MGCNQRYSARVAQKRRVDRVLTHIADSRGLIREIAVAYEGKHELIHKAALSLDETLDIVYDLVWQLRMEI